jgi:hypothetical protein
MKTIYRLLLILPVTALFACNMEMPHDCNLVVENTGKKNVILVAGKQDNDSVDVKDMIEYFSFLQDNEKRNKVARFTFNHIIKPSQIDTFCVGSWKKDTRLFFVDVDSLEYYLDNHLKTNKFNDYRKIVHNTNTLKAVNWHLKFDYDSLKVNNQ